MQMIQLARALACSLALTPLLATGALAQCVDDPLEDNESCATAAPLDDGGYYGLTVSDVDSDHYTFDLLDGDTVNASIFFSTDVADLDLWLWDAGVTPCGTGTTSGDLARSWTTSDDEDLSYTNTTGADQTLVLEVRMYSAGSSDCNAYDLELYGDPPCCFIPAFCMGDGSDGGVCPCGNESAPGAMEGCINATGAGAMLSASGSASISADTLVLQVTQAVPNEFGIFVQNLTGVSPMPFYNGLFCLAPDSHLVRHYNPSVGINPTVTDASGSGINAQALTVGDYLNDTQPGVSVGYQFWFRDNNGPCPHGANFSSGLWITWLP